MIKNSWFIFVLVLIISFFFGSCGGKKEGDNAAEISVEISYETKIKIQQYVAEGRKLYNQNCANCHQVNGEGLANLYPPLKNSDYFLNDTDAAICYIKNGLSGEITVNGTTFNQQMPANGLLTDLELAEILTYVINEMNGKTQLISQKDVKRVLKECRE